MRWIEEYNSWMIDNGSEYILINEQLFGRYNVQLYESMDSMTVTMEWDTYDFGEAVRKATDWLGLKSL